MILRLLKLFVLLLTVLSIAPLAEARRIRVAIPGYNITQIVFFTAKERGYYKEEGLDVDLIQMTGTLSNLEWRL
jgi:ABC-type nitrate/sulfonate/bicarbonate transport system substrate-binding protein